MSDHLSMLILIVLASYFMLANHDFDDLMNLTFLLCISKFVNFKFLSFILVNLLGADDLRRPPTQAKRRTPQQIGTTL